MKRTIGTIAALALLAACTAQAGETGGTNGKAAAFSLEKVTMRENPAGLGFGFWSNHGMSEKMYLDFGRRPYERYGFFSWNAIEKSPGKYDTGAIERGVRTIHSLGSTCIISLNNISGPWFNKAKGSQIPSFYTQDITDPATREAGKKYIRTVIARLLPRVGDLVVCFDYEMMWHCRPDTPAKQKMLRDWFLDAAAEARAAAKEVGMESSLKIIPIVNGAVDDGATTKMLNSPNAGHTPAQWLLDIVEVCDYLAIDSYDFDIDDPTNPEKTISTLSFWIRNYSQGKPVQITEFGYSTANTPFPDYRTTYHATGTEEQQRDFYAALLPLLVKENVPGGRLNGQVRSFCFWMYSDMQTKKAASERENNFGIVRLDGSKKPSFKVITEGIARIESDPATAASLEAVRKAVTPGMLSKGIESRFTSGTAYDWFILTPSDGKAGKRTISVSLSEPGALLAECGGTWYCSLEEGTAHTLSVTIPKGGKVRLFFTGGEYPFVQTIKNIELK